jgi:hypothetical protein
MKFLGLHFDTVFIRWVLYDSLLKKIAGSGVISHSNPEEILILIARERPQRIGASCQAVLRWIDLKISSKRKMLRGLPYQIENLTHLPEDEVCFTSEFFPKKGVKVHLCSKESLDSFLKMAQVSLDFLTPQAVALQQFVLSKAPLFQSGFVVYIGSKDCTCIWIEEGELKKSFHIELGVDFLLDALWKDRKKVLLEEEVRGIAQQIDLFQTNEQYNRHLCENLSLFKEKIQETICSFASHSGSKPLWILGHVDAFHHFDEYILQSMEGVERFDLPIPLTYEESKLALAWGAAVEGTSIFPVQLLSGEFTPKRQWRNAGLWGAISIFGSVAISLILAIGCGLSLSNQKQEMIDQFESLMGQFDASNKGFLFEKGLDTGIKESIRIIKNFDQESPYLLKAPNVSQVLDWLSSKGLEIHNFRYNLVTGPKINTLHDPHLVKVDLEFSSETLSAREFHQLLVSENELVDSKKEISWDTLENNRYRTTFYLKNRTPYVP